MIAIEQELSRNKNEGFKGTKIELEIGMMMRNRVSKRISRDEEKKGMLGVLKKQESNVAFGIWVKGYITKERQKKIGSGVKR